MISLKRIYEGKCMAHTQKLSHNTLTHIAMQKLLHFTWRSCNIICFNWALVWLKFSYLNILSHMGLAQMRINSLSLLPTPPFSMLTHDGSAYTHIYMGLLCHADPSLFVIYLFSFYFKFLFSISCLAIAPLLILNG